MKLKTSLKALAAAVIAAGAALVTTTGLSAASNTASMPVSATVTNNCTITTNPIAFGSYDPIVANATTDLDATGAVVIACTKGAVTTLGLDTGANSSASTRRLASSGDFLAYELYQDSNRSTVWGNSGAALYNSGTSPSKGARTFQVYGRITSGQDVQAGAYTDTIIATVNF